MMGPVIGSFIFKYGGFLAPFLSSGIGLLLTGVVSLWKCENLISNAETQVSEMPSSTSVIFPVLKNFVSFVSLLSATIAALQIGMGEEDVVLPVRVSDGFRSKYADIF